MRYPEGEPYDSGLMAAGDGHRICWEVYGSPTGKPAVVLHGGPGSGATSWWTTFFDPARYRVVLFDQRTTAHLDRIAHIPAHLLRGRLDIASPLRSACEVARQLPNATLDIVEADAHGAGDDTAKRLVAVLDRFARTRVG
jgi:pimeloyl-ACP methyl ester carboxylesterase